jgi:hypothetical protein
MSINDYEFDFLLSYPVHSGAGAWVRNHFFPVLKKELDIVGPPTTIFCWLENEIGVIWPVKLNRALARSRIMVAVLKPPYFYQSKWCPTEWHTMLEKNRLAGPDWQTLETRVLALDCTTERLPPSPQAPFNYAVMVHNAVAYNDDIAAGSRQPPINGPGTR